MNIFFGEVFIRAFYKLITEQAQEIKQESRTQTENIQRATHTGVNIEFTLDSKRSFKQVANCSHDVTDHYTHFHHTKWQASCVHFLLNWKGGKV